MWVLTPWMIAGIDTNFLGEWAAPTYEDHDQSEPWKERGWELVQSQQKLWNGKVKNQDNEQPFSGFHLLRHTCYSLVQNLLSFCLLSKSTKINIHKNIISPALLYAFETWILAVREVHLWVPEKWVLKRICGPKTEETT